jgi:hypothetical protein
MVYHLITVNRVVITSVVMSVTIPAGHVNVVDKKIAMLSLLCLMSVTVMCRVLRQVVVEVLVLQVLLEEEQVIKEKQDKQVFKD